MSSPIPPEASRPTQVSDLIFHLSLGSSATPQERLDTVRRQVRGLCERYALQETSLDLTDYGTEVRGHMMTAIMRVELRAW